jgi:hypothetical protein
MKKSQLAVLWCFVMCMCALCFVTGAHALVLRGQFPVHNGMYWNFSDNSTQQMKTWAVLGQFNRAGVGSLIVLAREGQGFVALREEWDGLYLHGEYRVDGFTMPETPVMFMPFEIDFDQAVTSSARVRVHAAGPGAQTVDEYDMNVTITLQALEDIVFENHEIRNCAVLVKKTNVQGVETTETFWLAPSIGPVKMRVEAPGDVRTYTLQSYRTERGPSPPELSLKKYFPLKPGMAYAYRDQSGETVSVRIGAREKRQGLKTVSYTEPGGDVYYLARDKRGLVFPIKYASTMGFAFVALPPDRPTVLLPARSAIGRLNHSLAYVRPCQWPSLEPMLDFYPENEINSVIVGIEDVTVPAGTYRNCIKLCFSSVSRSFNMQREKIRTAFVWFAPGVGEVKREGLSLSNAYLAATPDHIFQTESWELVSVGRFDLSKPVLPEQVTFTPPVVRVAPDELAWQDNSRAMFDATVDAAPFFVRRIVRRSLLDAVIDRAGADGAVSEDAVIAAVQATTPERMRDSITAELEQMTTR